MRYDSNAVLYTVAMESKHSFTAIADLYIFLVLSAHPGEQSDSKECFLVAFQQDFIGAPERTLKWGVHVAPEKILSCPSTFWLYKYN